MASELWPDTLCEGDAEARSMEERAGVDHRGARDERGGSCDGVETRGEFANSCRLDGRGVLNMSNAAK